MKQKKDVFIDTKKGVIHFFNKKQQTKTTTTTKEKKKKKKKKTYKNSKNPLA